MKGNISAIKIGGTLSTILIIYGVVKLIQSTNQLSHENTIIFELGSLIITSITLLAPLFMVKNIQNEAKGMFIWLYPIFIFIGIVELYLNHDSYGFGQFTTTITLPFCVIVSVYLYLKNKI